MRRIPALALPVLLALVLLSWPGAAEEFTGRVVAITDGDTIKILRHGHAEVVRLRGIDAPEKDQACGERAKQYLGDLVLGATVTLLAAQHDRRGRILADVSLQDGRNVNQEMVRAGYAWWFRKYSRDRHLAQLEAEAREARRGLWGDRHPVPPWQHRGAALLDMVPAGDRRACWCRRATHPWRCVHVANTWGETRECVGG